APPGRAKPTVGFEPTTPALRERCSGQLSYVGGGASLDAARPSPDMRTTPPVLVALSFRERLAGLAWRRHPRAAALFIPRCRSVHTAGMRFPVHLIWVERTGRVVRVDLGVRPWRVRSCRTAWGVIELATPASRPGV